MSPHLSEDDVDDLLYLARAGEEEEFRALKAELCQREGIAILQLLELARDEGNGNGVLHMAAANGHAGMLSTLFARFKGRRSFELDKFREPFPFLLYSHNADSRVL